MGYTPEYFNDQNSYSIEDEQSNLLLYHQFLEKMKATHEHKTHGIHPFVQLKEKFKKFFSRHKKVPEQGQQGIFNYVM